jgi:hypothetical protein
MTKTKTAVKAKKSKNQVSKKSESLSRQKGFFKLLVLLVVLALGFASTYKTLIAHADSNSVVYSSPISSSSHQYVFRSVNNGTMTATLSYAGLVPESVSLTILDEGPGVYGSNPPKFLTESSYGNPVIIQLNAAADHLYSLTVTPADFINRGNQGSFTLSISVSPDNLPPTTEPFRSMPCSYTPMPSAMLYPIEPCPGYSSPAPAPTPIPIISPIPTPAPAPTPPPKNTKDPTVPINLRIIATGPYNITLIWDPSTDASSPIAGYHIYRGTSPSNLSLLTNVTSTSYQNNYLIPSTTYYYYIQAYDAAGKVSDPTATVSTTTLPPNPPILPTIGISNPKNGTTVSGIVNVDGVAGSNSASIKSVQVEVDNNGFVSAALTPIISNNDGFDYTLNTRLYADTEHTITAKVTDSAGNSNTVSIKLTFKNGTYPAAPPLAQGTWESPEGMTIIVGTKGKNPHTGQPWTIADAYYMVKACAVGTGDFATIAPYYKVVINDDVGGWALDYSIVAGGTGVNGAWSNYAAASYLNGSVGPMLTQPYDVSCYEYGHVWTEYYYHLVDYPTTADGLNGSNQTAPPNYLSERWVNKSGSITLAQNNYCNSSTDGWDGCMTDDRRVLFGGAGTNGGSAAADLVPGEPNTGFQEPDIGYINGNIVPPQNQPGLAAWYIDHWMSGK